MPGQNHSTRHFEANLWLKTALELCARRHLTHSEKRVELERRLLRLKELVKAEIQECFRIEP